MTAQNPPSETPGLPPNVIIFNPKSPSSVDALLNARTFTRLVASSSCTPAKLVAIKKYPGVKEDFCLLHRNAVLIFDAGDDEDLHHEHFRVICLALKEYDIGLDVAGCIHDATDALAAGFQLDRLSDKAALVIDLVVEEDSDEDSDA